MNPKNSAGVPKDAGKRRVHAAVGKSAGHWFTASDGKRVSSSSLLVPLMILFSAFCL